MKKNKENAKYEDARFQRIAFITRHITVNFIKTMFHKICQIKSVGRGLGMKPGWMSCYPASIKLWVQIQHCRNQVCWWTPEIPAPENGNRRVKSSWASLGYMESSRWAWVMWDLFAKKKKISKEEHTILNIYLTTLVLVLKKIKTGV